MGLDDMQKKSDYFGSYCDVMSHDGTMHGNFKIVIS